MAEPSILQVFVFREGIYVGSEVFTEPEIVIGSGEGVDLHLEDAAVEASHAILKHERGETSTQHGQGVSHAHRPARVRG